jgi:membrane-associated protease RseP (regulator of RpoE activity)
MKLSLRNFFAALALASVGVAGLATADEDSTKTAEPNVYRARVVKALAEASEEATPYWIGVQLEPPPEILKSHLNLEAGMVAVHIFEGSPAEKAGLKANDIILKAGESYVKEPGDLLKCVGAAKGSEITLVVLRAGKETSFKVTPAKRPQETNPQAVKEAEKEEKEAMKKLSAALDIYRRHTVDAGEAKAVDVLRLRPGVVTAAPAEVELPKDVSVTITIEGAGPAKIIVKKDGKQYEATEDKLDQLPKDVLPYVRSIREGGSGATFHYPRATSGATGSSAKTGVFKVVPVPAPALPPSSVEAAKVYRYHVESRHGADDVGSKLDQILKIVSQQEDSDVSALRKEVQQLRKELEELRKEKK